MISVYIFAVLANGKKGQPLSYLVGPTFALITDAFAAAAFP